MNFSVADDADTAPPVIINNPPANQSLSVKDNKKDFYVQTDGEAICKWDTADKDYDDMINTMVDDGYHLYRYKSSITGLVVGELYTVYVRCADDVGNAMTSSWSFSFSVAGGSGSSVVVGSYGSGAQLNLPTVPQQMTNTQPQSQEQANTNTDVIFTKDLWYQLRDIDVRLLQIFLNSKGFTVSDAGAGSTGQETTYFGLKTKDALIRFQEAYASQVLAPFGLTVGTGFFGPLTRNLVNSLL